MRSFAKLLPLLLCAPLLAVGVAAPAVADPMPEVEASWPMCHQGADDDGQYCIVSVTRNGVPAPLVAGSTDGDYEVPVVQLLGPGTGTVGNDLGIGVGHWLNAGEASDDPSIDPAAEWVFELNTGGIRFTELTGNLRDVVQVSGGDASGGWTTTVAFRPVPIAWLSDWDACTFENGCGDDTTVADQVYDGFVTARLSDGTTEGRPAWAVAARAGLVEVGNAQGVATTYDFDTNALVVGLVNPHLRSSGPDVVASGWFETFLPDAWLTRNYHVPDPTTLTKASFAVRRVGSTAPVDHTVTRATGGVWIRISDFTFSAPEFRVRPKPSAPGVPRWGSVVRVAPRTIRVRFRAPVADGGADIRTYTARCRRGDGTWHKASGPDSPLRLSAVPRKPVQCQVRAANRLGAGGWSTFRTA